jgi:hypothetical protein
MTNSAKKGRSTGKNDKLIVGTSNNEPKKHNMRINRSAIPAEFHGLTDKQITFCYLYANTYDWKNSAKLAGYQGGSITKSQLMTPTTKRFVEFIQSQNDTDPLPTRPDLAKRLVERVFTDKKAATNRDIVLLIDKLDELLGHKEDMKRNISVNVTLPDTYYEQFGLPRAIEIDADDAEIVDDRTKLLGPAPESDEKKQ